MSEILYCEISPQSYYITVVSPCVKLIKFCICFFFLVNTTRCLHIRRVRLIFVRGLACLWPQSAFNGFHIPAIETPCSSSIGDDSLLTAPHRGYFNCNDNEPSWQLTYITLSYNMQCISLSLIRKIQLSALLLRKVWEKGMILTISFRFLSLQTYTFSLIIITTLIYNIIFVLLSTQAHPCLKYLSPSSRGAGANNVLIIMASFEIYAIL